MAVVWATVVLLGVFGVLGWRAGVVKRLVELVGVVAAVLVTARFAASIAPFLAERLPLDDTAVLVMAHVFMFLAALILVRYIAKGVARLVRWTPLGWVDKIGGALCGVLLAAIIASVGLIAVSQAPGGEAVKTTYTENIVGNVIYRAAPFIYQGLHRLIDGRADELWQRAVEVGREVAEDAAATQDDR